MVFNLPGTACKSDCNPKHCCKYHVHYQHSYSGLVVFQICIQRACLAWYFVAGNAASDEAHANVNRALTKPNRTRGIRTNFKLPFVARSEAICTLPRCILVHNTTIYIDTISKPPQARGCGISGQLRNTISNSKWWLRTRVSHALITEFSTWAE